MLGSEDRAILDFERAWWREPGAKDQAIEFALGLSASAFYDRLLALIASPEALAYDPMTVRRVRAIIEPLPAEVAV